MKRWTKRVTVIISLSTVWILIVVSIFFISIPENKAMISLGLNPLGIDLTEIIRNYKEFECDGVVLYSFEPDQKNMKVISSWDVLPFDEETCDYLDTRLLPKEYPNVENGYGKIIYKKYNQENIYGFAVGLYDNKEKKGYLLLYDL